MRGIWAGIMGREVLPLVEYRYTRGFDLDADYRLPDMLKSVEIAHVLYRVDHVALPDTDRQLLAYLQRGGHRANRASWWMVARVHDEERLAITTPAGTVESTGEHFALIENPEPDRYTEHFCIPGLWYMGARTEAEQERTQQ